MHVRYAAVKTHHFLAVKTKPKAQWKWVAALTQKGVGNYHDII